MSASRSRVAPRKSPEQFDDEGFRAYVKEIAHARYLVRKIFRIVDEHAKTAGLDPLQHQMLIQISGFAGNPLPVNSLADRMDIVPAFASRIITSLERAGLVKRVHSTVDKRVTLVEPTAEGLAMLQSIDSQVQTHVRAFQEQIDQADREAASETFRFYIGLD